MGPPISTWPYSDAAVNQLSDIDNDSRDSDSDSRGGRSVRRVICLNLAFVVLCQVITSLSSVGAGPVLLNMDYMQGPVPLARNIRHLPCVSRRTAQEGLCMFAIDCLKANGSHLGTCIDRFYFGSCCQIPDKTVIPQILTNHIDDNSIDNANFVHPQKEDNIHKIPELFPTRKPTTQKIETTTKEATERTESVELETKSDEQTTIDDRIINDEKLTTAVVIETTTKLVEKTERPITEVPIKLSTFQTVSGELSTTSSTEKTQDKLETPEVVSTTSTTTKKPTRKPVRPFTRPTHKPYNTTRPLYTLSTLKPKPPIALYNTTRKPPYKLPPKRPTTKKPFPIPPRLNITILPQSTSSKPLLTRPSSASITYINTTQVSTTKEEPKTTTTTTTTTTSTTTSTTTEKIVETTEAAIETTVLTTESPTEKTEKTTETITTIETEKPTTVSLEKGTTNQDVDESKPNDEKESSDKDEEKETNDNTTSQELEKETTNQEEQIGTTVQEVVTEKETIKPATAGDIPSTIAEATTSTSTEYPPLMTWTNTVDAVTKAPEKVTEPSEEIWSPITPPEGWILLSSIKPDTSSTTETAEPVAETTIKIIETTERVVETTTSPEPVLTTITTTTEATTTTQSTTQTPSQPTTQPTTQPATQPPTTQSSTTESTTSSSTTQSLVEFTVNITLTPTVPTTTPSVGLTTFTSVTTADNSTKANVTETTTTVTEAPTTTTTEFSLENLGNDKNDYKKAPTGRIVGGEKSGFGMWPWQISLRQYRTSTYLHKCGAALLNENWAITAAHCVEHVPPSELLVRLGEHDLANEDEPYGFAERRVQIVASHPHFDSATFEYDLALLRFYEPVKFQPNILPICVPDTDEDFVGRTAYVTGWGRLYDEGPLPSVLQEVKVPVINNSACETMYQTAGYNEHIPHIFICAGRAKGGTDSCEGDSGGPMVIPRERDGRFVLSGIISWGIGCAEPNQPGVYTRISEFRDWINQILQF